MKEYIESMIPRLKEFSQSLDRKEVFVEVTWVLIDSEGGFQKYIFRRNGELVMSRNGTVTIGKWECLVAAKSLLIDRVTDKILLNQNFIDPAVMVLNQDGLNGGNVILMNELLIPDLDVEKYLRQLFYLKNKIMIRELTDGTQLEFQTDGFSYIPYGSLTSIKMKPIESGRYCSVNNKIYVVESSKLKRVLVSQNFQTSKGDVVIEYDPTEGKNRIGNQIFVYGKPATLLDIFKNRMIFWG